MVEPQSIKTFGTKPTAGCGRVERRRVIIDYNGFNTANRDEKEEAWLTT